ncbi:MAG: hypothetical protein OEL89_03315, partial [Candidatus Peregrinibacteria bacterium]|nr:hypothetical protein [Candidatus Peregrinibacteria bacterium]
MKQKNIVTQNFWTFRLLTFLIILTAILLPWHGAISVFLPDDFKFWKEVIFGVLFLIMIGLEFFSFIRKRWNKLNGGEVLAGLFCAWLAVLVLIGKGEFYQILAARYLGFGVFVFFVLSRILRNFDRKSQQVLLRSFVRPFVFSCILSVLFGV